MRNLKSHLFYIYLAFRRHREGFFYLWMRYIVAPRILTTRVVLEKPSTHLTLSMHMLFGHRDLVIACWSLASYFKNSHLIGSLVIHSDGTLTDNDKKILRRLFPSVQILEARQLVSAAQDALSHHPRTHELFGMPLWQGRKLLDPFLSTGKEYVLVLDSDLLWFKDPSVLQQYLSHPSDSAIMMSNGPTPCFISFKDGSRLDSERAMANSGVVLFRKSLFDLDRLEKYLSTVELQPHQFLEQAGYASLFPALSLLSEMEYVIKGRSESEVIMRHYTGPNRAKFFLRGIPYLCKTSLSYVCN